MSSRASSEAGVKTLAEQAAPEKTFLQDECRPDGKVPCLVLFTAYQEWAKPADTTPVTPGASARLCMPTSNTLRPPATCAGTRSGAEKRRGPFYIGVSLCAHEDDCPHTIDDGLVVVLEPLRTWGNLLRSRLAA